MLFSFPPQVVIVQHLLDNYNDFTRLYVDENAIRQSVREPIDKYAPSRDFAMCGGANIVSMAGDDRAAKVRGWVLDEARSYGMTFIRIIRKRLIGMEVLYEMVG